MEKARGAFIDMVCRYRKKKDHDITIVFDGYRNGMATQQESFRDGVRLIFSRLGERADDVIKKIVSQDRKEWIVVTADRDIADHAWATGSVVVPPDRFMEIIERKHMTESPAVHHTSEEYEETGKQMRKGNPFQLSRKEKALRRILKKL
jgi:predicted RNA-binding protein with PIN domain